MILFHQFVQPIMSRDFFSSVIYSLLAHLFPITHPTRYIVGCIIQKRMCFFGFQLQIGTLLFLLFSQFLLFSPLSFTTFKFKMKQAVPSFRIQDSKSFFSKKICGRFIDPIKEYLFKVILLSQENLLSKKNKIEERIYLFLGNCNYICIQSFFKVSYINKLSQKETSRSSKPFQRQQ